VVRTFINILILVVVVLTSCKKQEATTPTSQAPPIPAPAAPLPPVDISTTTQYLNRFVSLATAHGITVDTSKLTIAYDSSLTALNILGTCSRGYNVNGTIAVSSVRLNKSYWEAWYNAGRKSELEQLIFHEFGHCLLNRNHNDATVASTDYGSQVEVSIMSSYHISSNLYEYNYTYYIDELYVLYTPSAGTYNPATTVSYSPISVGATPLYAVATSGFNGGVYASTLASYLAPTIVKTETFAIQVNEIHPNADFDSEKVIENFYCDDAVIIH
jgi:hypothetical protein